MAVYETECFSLNANNSHKQKAQSTRLCTTCSARSWISGSGSTITRWKMCLRASCSRAAVQLIPLPTPGCAVRVRSVCNVARRTDDVLWHRKGHKRGTTSLSGCGLWIEHTQIKHSYSTIAWDNTENNNLAWDNVDFLGLRPSSVFNKAYP
jgi:hypothetical protein